MWHVMVGENRFPLWWDPHTSYASRQRQNLKRWTHWRCLGSQGKTRWGYQQSEWKPVTGCLIFSRLMGWKLICMCVYRLDVLRSESMSDSGSHLRYVSVAYLFSDRFYLKSHKVMSKLPPQSDNSWLIGIFWLKLLECRYLLYWSRWTNCWLWYRLDLMGILCRTHLSGLLKVNDAKVRTWVKCKMMSKLPPQSDYSWLTGILWIKHPHKARCGNKMFELQLIWFYVSK